MHDLELEPERSRGAVAAYRHTFVLAIGRGAETVAAADEFATVDQPGESHPISGGSPPT